MCRNAPGRRCPCDTSEARAARRRAAKLRNQYAGQVKPKAEPHPSPADVDVVETAVAAPEVPREEQLKAEAVAILQDFPDYGDMYAAPRTDEHVIKLGSVVDELSVEYGAPTDEEIASAVGEKEQEELALRKTAADMQLQINGLPEECARKLAEAHHIPDNIAVSPYQTIRYIRDSEPDNPILKEYDSELEQKRQEIHGVYTRCGEVRDERTALRAEFLAKRSEALQKALSSVGVQFADPATLKTGGKTQKAALESLHSALPYFPQSWVDSSNNAMETTQSPLVVKGSKARAHYSDKKLQKTSTFMTKSRVSPVLKDKDWTPDPFNRSESEYEEMPPGGWVDPAVKSHEYRHEGYTSFNQETQKQWIRRQYDYLPSGSKPRKGYTAVEVYKEEWVPGQGRVVSTETETLYRKPRVKKQQDSASYSRISELTVNGVGGKEGTRVAMHEFSHRVETHNPEVLRMQAAFLRRRAGLDTDTPEKLTRIAHHGAQEKGYKDNFPHHYMGKTYEGRNFEVLSMGMETLFSGSQGGFYGEQEYTADRDYKRFILGALASSARK